MNVWCDDTGLQSAGLAMQGRARSDWDVLGLLQFATWVVFADRLYLNGSEPEEVRGRTEFILDILSSFGAPNTLVTTYEFERSTFARACESAASDCADSRLDWRFAEHVHHSALLPARIPESVLTSEVALIDQVTSAEDLEDSSDDPLSVLDAETGSAVQFMLRVSEELRTSLRELRGTTSWSDSVILHVIASLRYHLNHALARSCDTRFSEPDVEGVPLSYAPSVARAGIVRLEAQTLLARLDKALEDPSSQVRERPLMLPSVSTYLFRRGGGHPRGVIEEALALRERTVGLRAGITDLSLSRDIWDVREHFELNQRIREEALALSSELGVDEAPLLSHAIDVVVDCGIPVAGISGRKLCDWIESRSKPRRIAVLADVSKVEATSFREEPYYRRLCRECGVNTRDS